MGASRRVVGVTVVVLTAAFALSPPPSPKTYDNDQYLYQGTVRRMRAGQGYYEASEQTFRAAGGTIETARGYRLPTAFLLWRLLPERGLWPAYVIVVAGATALILLAGGVAPIAVLLCFLYLLILGKFSVEYLFVELWAVPLVAGAMVASVARRWWPAAGLALAATTVRELAVLLIVGGLLAALVRKHPTKPWVGALATAAVLYGLHIVLVSSHLGSHGTEGRLLGTGSLSAAAHMMGFQLPAGVVVGPLLWSAALVWLRRTDRLLAVGPYAALPLLGLVADRPYWGGMVVPFLLVWSYELAASQLTPHIWRK
jgi:hypothetical protein